MRSLVTLVVLCLSLAACSGGGSGLTPPPTGGGPGTSPVPIVTSTTPSSEAVCVLPTSPVSLAFSETLSPGSVYSGNFSVQTPSGVSVAGSLLINDRTATFTPNTTLATNTLYTATLALDGAPAPYTWSFTTTAATTSGNYRVCWKPVNDGRLAGYRIYHNTSSPVTTAATNLAVGNVTTWEFTPAELGVSGQTVYIAVTANSAAPAEESALSTQATVVIQ